MTNNQRREANREKINRLETEAAEMKREIGRLVHRIETQKKLYRASEKERLSAVRGYELMCRAYELLIIRVGLRFGDHVMDEERGKNIGRRLRLPFVEKPDELLAMWQAKARKDEEARETVIAVGLRDDPDDHKHDAELEAEAEAYRMQKEAQGE